MQQMRSEKTWFHHLTRRKTGEIPHWVLSSSGCTSDAIGIGETMCGLITSGVYLLRIINRFQHGTDPTFVDGLIGLVMFAIPSVLGFVLFEPVRTSERKARARRR